VLGSVPAVLVGSLLSSTAPDRYIRPAITFVIAASGLKYVGVDTTTLGWILCATLLLCASLWLAVRRPWLRPVAGGELGPSEVDALEIEEQLSGGLQTPGADEQARAVGRAAANPSAER
jgi:hypothetical protein